MQLIKSTGKLLIFLAFNATDDQYNYLASFSFHVLI